MAKKDSQVDARRLIVAEGLSRGWSYREIERHFREKSRTEPGLLNPETNEPWSRATLARDGMAILAEWKKQLEKRGEFYFSLQLQRREKLLSLAITEGNLSLARQILLDIDAMLGLDRIRGRGTGDDSPSTPGGVRTFQDIYDMARTGFDRDELIDAEFTEVDSIALEKKLLDESKETDQ